MKKALGIIGKILGVLLVLWIAVSWVEVVSQNIAPNPEYSPINFFAVMLSLTA